MKSLEKARKFIQSDSMLSIQYDKVEVMRENVRRANDENGSRVN